MTLRRWKYEDILHISEIECESFGKAAWSFKTLASLFESENFLGVLMEDGDEVVGYGGVTVAVDTADVENVAVTEAYRNSGVATAILSELERLSKERGVEKIFLEVRVSNRAAMSLYLKLGYVGVYARTRYYEDGEDCLVMVKNLV